MITEKNLNVGLFGLFLIVLALGSMFAIELVFLSYWILIGAAIIVFNYVSNALIMQYRKKKITFGYNLIGMLGSYLLTFLFGIQSPQVPFKPWILGVGLILLLPAIKNHFKK